MKRHTRAVAALSAFLVVGGAGVAPADNLVADGAAEGEGTSSHDGLLGTA